MQTYKILRYFQSAKEPLIIKTGLSIQEARAWILSLESNSKKATDPEAVALTKKYGNWIDGFSKEKQRIRSQALTPGRRIVW